MLRSVTRVRVATGKWWRGTVNPTVAEGKNDWHGQRPRITGKSEWSVFDKTSQFNHNLLLNIVAKKQSRAIRWQKKHNQTHIMHFQTQFGVSDFLKQILKLFFAHSNLLYNFCEQTKSLGDSVFARSWPFGGTFSKDKEMKKNALQKQL